jgi:hypothetical protein
VALQSGDSSTEFQVIQQLHGPAFRPGQFHAVVVGPGYQPKQDAVFIPTGWRRKYVRCPRLEVSDFIVEDRQKPNGLILPRWSRTVRQLQAWHLSKVEEADGFSIPPEEVLPTATSVPNRWCHTPGDPCERTDPEAGEKAIRAHLDYEGFPHVIPLWVRRRYLYYVSDGNSMTQAGFLLDEDDKPRFYSDRLLLWEGEAWMMQLGVYGSDLSNKPIILSRSPIFVTDDMTFVSTFQCLRVGQTQAEYNKGINLYTPALSPMSLADYLRGPLSDLLIREERVDVRLLRPTIRTYSPREPVADLQAKLLANLDKKWKKEEAEEKLMNSPTLAKWRAKVESGESGATASCGCAYCWRCSHAQCKHGYVTCDGCWSTYGVAGLCNKVSFKPATAHKGSKSGEYNVILSDSNTVSGSGDPNW